MDLQTYLNDTVRTARKNRFNQSDQLSLGDMIKRLEAIAAKQQAIIKKYNSEAEVVYDFEYLYPTSIDSWRGIYAELALNFVGTYRGIDSPDKMTVSSFLQMLKGCIGKSFTGYKGGEFEMSEETPVWVANYGHSGNTAVLDIVDKEYEVIIMTGYRKS